MGDNSWTVVSNKEEKSVFVYGTIDQKITANNPTVFYIINDENVGLNNVSELCNENAQSISLDRVSLGKPVSDIKLYLWIEHHDGNSIVYLQTEENVDLTSVKFHFDTEFDHNAMLQYELGTIINAFGENPWTVIPNKTEKTIFVRERERRESRWTQW